MAYSDFESVGRVQDALGVSISSARSLFHHVGPMAASQNLTENLTENIPLALNINTALAYSHLWQC